MAHFVYILASRKRGALYIGRSIKLRERVEQHRTGTGNAHTRRYGIFTLVYFETHEAVETAVTREAKLKRWKRQWKIDLIEANNPEWNDLVSDMPL